MLSVDAHEVFSFDVNNFLQIELNFTTEPRKVKESRHGVVFYCYYLSLNNSA